MSAWGTAVSVVGNPEPNLVLTSEKMWFQTYPNKQNLPFIGMIQPERKNNETQYLNTNVDKTNRKIKVLFQEFQNKSTFIEMHPIRSDLTAFHKKITVGTSGITCHLSLTSLLWL